MSRASALAREPPVSISDMKQFFGWARTETADRYIVTGRSTKKIGVFLDPSP